ncbi:NUDIX domain-containing protein [Kineosporia sp. NBRC 101731]|uniref:NUDIX hydrolase n=1 Tax=Kineosporia sp. NBRC 101731 TaxID=3032199 RepID=UPI0024A1C9C7|nr:NUDIX domain-containing protein [Kineosporia sp. NBRC 101731]GLY30826.1 DNA mismatch repair protein MutT [Kineosporia sp. NBRC 101731]
MTVLIDKIALIHVTDGQILSTRSRGKDVYYLPGGKREAGESDIDTLVREVSEELAVVVDPGTAVHVGTFEARADGQPDGTMVRMTCYTADFEGTPVASSEIAELVRLTYSDRDRVSPVDQIVFDHLRDRSWLR